MTALGEFARWQPEYAARGIPTFPVNETKRPAVANYLRLGKPASAKLASSARFAAADAFGLALGERTRLAVLDCDTSDERIFADALDRYGRSPFIVRSGSGNFQAWFRWNGERRAIRPDPSIPIDVLGSGFVVGPPSKARKGRYQIIEGGLDDLSSLPTLKMATPTDFGRRTGDLPVTAGKGWREMRAGSGRNDALFRRLGREARNCDDLDQLIDRARTLNGEFGEPLPEREIVATAQSVWQMTIEGRNRFGKFGAWFDAVDVRKLVSDPDLFALTAWLKAHNSPRSEFMIADGLQQEFGWSRRQLAGARHRAITSGLVVQLVAPAPGRAALYRWGGAGEGMLVEDSLPKSVGVAISGAA